MVNSQYSSHSLHSATMSNRRTPPEVAIQLADAKATADPTTTTTMNGPLVSPVPQPQSYIGLKVELTHLIVRLLCLFTSITSLLLMITAKQSATISIYGFNLPVYSKWSFSDSFEYLVGVSAAVAVHTVLQLLISSSRLLRKSPIIPSRNHAWLMFAGDQIFAYTVMSAGSAASGVTNLNRTGIRHSALPNFCKPLGHFCDHVAVSIAFTFISCFLLATSAVLDVVWLSSVGCFKCNKKKEREIKILEGVSPRYGRGRGVDESYRPLPSLYLAFTFLWSLFSFCWTINTYKNRHFQTNKLQWTLASVPLIKALQLSLSFLFWYSCFYMETCSLWMSFGVYVTGVLFHTASFVAFFLISHGYCIMCERLTVPERRTIAALGCGFYLILVGHRASVPYFSVLLVFNYSISLYMIFHHTSQNLLVLRQQLEFVVDQDVYAMHDAVYTKYTMFKKFQGAMQIVAIVESAIFINMSNSLETYWLRVLLREWAQFSIFLYISWIFRSQDLAPRFSVMPTLKSTRERLVPPIYSIEMNAEKFKDFSSHEWHIGVPTSIHDRSLKHSMLVVVQHPHANRPTMEDSTSAIPVAVAVTN